MELKNTDVIELLRMLQKPDLGLNWLAEEIYSLIQAGKAEKVTFLETGQKQRKRGETTQPYSAEEELVVALDVIEARALSPATYWENALKFTDEAMTGQDQTDSSLIEAPLGASMASVSGKIDLSLIDDFRYREEFRRISSFSRRALIRLDNLLAEARKSGMS